MNTVLHGLGIVLAVEGLAIALAPLRLEQALQALAGLSRDGRRALGLAVLAAGVAVIWAAGRMG